MDEKTIVLLKPVTIGDIVYEKLDLREPTAGELNQASKADSNIGMAIILIQVIAKVPKSVVEKLCQRDFQAANDFLGSFGSNSRQTGETLSQ